MTSQINIKKSEMIISNIQTKINRYFGIDFKNHGLMDLIKETLLLVDCHFVFLREWLQYKRIKLKECYAVHKIKIIMLYREFQNNLFQN